MRVKEVMSCDVVVASLSSSYKELAEVMLRHDVSGLPVVEEDGTLVGIVTEGDLIRRQGFAHSSTHRGARFLTHLFADAEPYVVRRCEGMTAADLMTQPVLAARPDDDIQAAARTMVRNGVKRLPVVKDGKVVGIVARPDLMRIYDRPDKDIQAEVSKTLADPMLAPEDNDAVAVVYDGVVTLTGTVRYPSNRAVTGAVARGVPGVVDIRNQLTAREVAPTIEKADGTFVF